MAGQVKKTRFFIVCKSSLPSISQYVPVNSGWQCHISVDFKSKGKYYISQCALGISKLHLSFSSQLLTSKECTQCTKEAIDWGVSAWAQIKSMFPFNTHTCCINASVYFLALIRDKISIERSSDKCISSESLHLPHDCKIQFMRVYTTTTPLKVIWVCRGYNSSQKKHKSNSYENRVISETSTHGVKYYFWHFLIGTIIIHHKNESE